MPYKDLQKRAAYMRGYRKGKVYVNPEEMSNTAIAEGLRKPDIAATLQDMYKFSEFNEESFDGFMRKPYTIMPKSEGEWYLIVPKFSGLEYGWLAQADENYNIFIINRYVSWLTPLPEDIRGEINLKPPEIDVRLDGNVAIFDPERKEDFRKKYGKHVFRYLEDGKARIKSTSIFDLSSQLVRDGVLPFTPMPVDHDYFSNSEALVELRDYQLRAWEEFLEKGAVGIYWPPGAGKMFISLYALARLKGPKLIVVPSLTLIEEWSKKIKAMVPEERQHEIEIVTYVSAKKHQGKTKPFTLTIYDEAQHLPARTYESLSGINTLYRMGLSATPFREDGRSDLIFALTGYPIGLDWKEYLDSGIIHRPKATCYIVKDITRKKEFAAGLAMQAKGRTLIFSDRLDIGREMSRRLNVPFVFGQTKNRLQIIAENRITVVSRIGDEGLDLTDLETVIEIDFLFGSRMQEMQRFGRLLHSRYKGRYIIVMTRDEYANYRKRLLALYEKGFEVEKKEVLN